MRRAGASEHEDDDGERRKPPWAVGAGAPLCWTLGAGLSGSAGPCTDGTEARERVTGTCTGSGRVCAHSWTTRALAASVVSLHLNEQHVVLDTIVEGETVAGLGLRIRDAWGCGDGGC